MANKSAKDLAFDKERAKYRKEIRELKYELESKDISIRLLTEEVAELSTKIGELQEWIDRLLEYTEMSEEDMKKVINKEKDTAEAIEHFNSLFNIMGRFGGGFV